MLGNLRRGEGRGWCSAWVSDREAVSSPHSEAARTAEKREGAGTFRTQPVPGGPAGRGSV